MNQDNLQLLRDGQTEPPTPLLQLRAGDLTMAFDPATVCLRYVRLGTTEILRGVYAAVRDRHWNTVRPVLSNMASIVSERSFRLTFDVRCVEGDVDFAWQGSLVGSENGVVRFELDGEALSSFERNRIGLCVLHPTTTCAGLPCGIERTDGTRVEGLFPAQVAPGELFHDVRAIAHEVAPGVVVEVQCEGDAFESEDQRNWTDSSYKTFSTPLALPRPVRVDAGTRVRQAVELRLHRHPESPGVTLPPATPNLVVEVPQAVELGPRVPTGLGFASHGRPLGSVEVERLKAIRPDHLKVELRPSRPGWESRLGDASRQASALGSTLHVAVLVGDDAERELGSVADAVEREAASVSLFLVLDEGRPVTPPSTVEAARRLLGTRWPDVPLAVGTNSNFAELNRNRPPAGETAMPCFAITPQIHAVDNLSVMENLEAQSAPVETAATFSDQQVVISPVTLLPRSSVTAESLPPADPRQKSLFGAAWTLGSLARLAGLGAVHRLTYYETSGAGGLVDGDVVHPLYHVFCDVGGCARFAGLVSPDPLRLAVALGETDSGQRRVFLANLTNSVQVVRLRVEAKGARARVLDELTGELAILKPEAFRTDPGFRLGAEGGAFALSLRPFATASVDLS